MFEKLKEFYRHMIMDAKALLRGERRVAEGYRGRTHTKGSGSNDLTAAKSKPVMRIQINSITDGKTGKVYTQEEWLERFKNG